MNHYFNLPLFLVIVVCFVLPAPLAYLALALMRRVRETKALDREFGPRTMRLEFVTHDSGRTWYNEGRFMTASPLTDALQDHYSEKRGSQ